MKKLLAVLLMLTLVAGAAFAQLGGVAAGGITLFQGDDGDDSDVTSGYHIRRFRLEGSGATEDGQFGGWIRYDVGPWWGAGAPGVDGWAFAYWKPHDMFKFQIGANPDGHFGADGIMRWGFYETAGDLAGVVNEGWAYGDAFYGGWDNRESAIFTLAPIDGLEINWGVPFGMGGATTAEVFAQGHAQVSYTLPDVGRFALTYIGGLNRDNGGGLTFDEDGDIDGFDSDASSLYIYAGLGLIENLSIDVGIKFAFPDEFEYLTEKGTYNAPISAGLGLHYSAEAFGVKLRAMGTFGGSMKIGSETADNKNANIKFDLLPYYRVNENFTAFLSFGLNIDTFDPDYEIDNLVSFHLNPYIVIGNQWSAAFYLGFRLESNAFHKEDGKADSSINWSVPVTISWSF